MTSRVIQAIPCWAKLSHMHRLQVAYKSKDLDNFILHFLYLALDQKGESKYEKPITGIIARLTDWPLRSITNAMKRLEDAGEFLRVGTKAVSINDKTANRQRWQWHESRYYGKQPQYSDAQLQLAEKVKEFIPNNKLLFNSEEEDVQQLKHDLRETREELATVNERLAEIKEALDLLMSRARAEDAAQAKTIIERHLKLVE